MSRPHVPGWNSPRDLPLANLPCCIVPWTEWLTLHQFQACSEVCICRTPISHTLAAFFSKNWHSRRGHAKRAAVPFPVPTMGASWPFGLGEPCFITRLPGISTFSMREGILCYVCPMGHFVLMLVLAMCAVAPVTVYCKFNFINKKIVSNWMKKGCVVMVCGMDSVVPFVFCTWNSVSFPGSQRGQLTPQWGGSPGVPRQLLGGAALDTGTAVKMSFLKGKGKTSQLLSDVPFNYYWGDTFGIEWVRVWGKVISKRLYTWALTYVCLRSKAEQESISYPFPGQLYLSLALSQLPSQILKN